MWSAPKISTTSSNPRRNFSIWYAMSGRRYVSLPVLLTITLSCSPPVCSCLEPFCTFLIVNESLRFKRRDHLFWLPASRPWIGWRPTPPFRAPGSRRSHRYISFPGQALAYMVGKREIVRLRRWPPSDSAPASTCGTSTTSYSGPASSPCRRWPARSNAGSCAAAGETGLAVEHPEVVAEGILDDVHPLPGVQSPTSSRRPSRARADEHVDCNSANVNRSVRTAPRRPDTKRATCQLRLLRRGRNGRSTHRPIWRAVPWAKRFIQAQTGTRTPLSSQYSARVPPRNASDSKAIVPQAVYCSLFCTSRSPLPPRAAPATGSRQPPATLCGSFDDCCRGEGPQALRTAVSRRLCVRPADPVLKNGPGAHRPRRPARPGSRRRGTRQ